MFSTSGLMILYHAVSLLIALLMVYIIFKEHRSWHKQVFAAIVFIPFILRAVGIK